MQGVALLGLGRIGKIHLKNLLANPRVSLLYVVEEFVDAARAELDVYGAGSVQVVKTNQLDQVLADERQTNVFFSLLLK